MDDFFSTENTRVLLFYKLYEFSAVLEFITALCYS